MANINPNDVVWDNATQKDTQSSPPATQTSSINPSQVQWDSGENAPVFTESNIPQEAPINTQQNSFDPNKITRMYKDSMKAMSDPTAIASGTNYLNASMVASQHVRGMGQDILSKLIGVDKMSNEPFKAAKAVGKSIPQNVPFFDTKSSQLGEIPLGEAVSKISPQSVAEFSLAELSDPINYVTMLSGLAKAPNANQLLKQASKLDLKAQEMTTKFLQPDVKQLAHSINKGFTLLSIEEASKIITEAKTYEEIASTFQSTIGKAAKERANILQSFNKEIDQTKLLSTMDKFMAEEASKGVRKKSFMKAIDDVFYRELDHLEKNPGFDIIKAQERKELLQNMTEPIMHKRRLGTLTERENAELIAYDVIRKAYKDSILQTVPRDQAKSVFRLNKQMEGLIEAKNFAVQQAAIRKANQASTGIERAVSGLGLSPQLAVFKGATRHLIEKFSIPRTTRKIGELNNLSNLLKTLAKDSKKISNPKGFSLSSQGLKAGRANN